MLVLVLIGLIYILWAWSNRNRKKDEPPVCSGGILLLGHAFKFIGDSAKLWRSLQKINKEAFERGDVLKTTVGPRTLYMVSSPEESLTVSNACLEKDAVYAFSKPWYGDGLLTSDPKTYSMMSLKVTLTHICRNYLIYGDHTKLKLKLDVLLKPVSGHYITIEKRK